jgi:hypothetical protein
VAAAEFFYRRMLAQLTESGDLRADHRAIYFCPADDNLPVREHELAWPMTPDQVREEFKAQKR